MAGDCGAILKLVDPVKTFAFDAIGKYVGYIGSCEVHLGELRTSLRDLCNKKDYIKDKVKEGKDKREKITNEAATWLQDVRIFAMGEELKELMYKDMETAKLVLRMMGKKDLKRRLSEESEMQVLMVKVMKNLKEEMLNSKEQEMRKMKEIEYKHVAQVVVDVMKDTVDEFKKLIKEDKEMAVIATRTLKGTDLVKLTKGDIEMEEIIREAGDGNDDELLPNHNDDEPNAQQPLLVKVPGLSTGKNAVTEAAKKLFTPLLNLLTPLENLMNDAHFKKAVPEADALKLGFEVIDGLLIKSHELKSEMDGSTKQNRGCCCSLLSPCEYHGRYQMSKAAEFMRNYIQAELISKSPDDRVTSRIRAVDSTPIPTQFLKGLESRTKLLDQILKKLDDDQVDAIGVFGMGGTGKTTLAKEVNKRVRDIFSIKVMVEVSDAPDIVRIQAGIAESIDLPLHDVDNVAQRADRLYNRLILEKEKKVLIILDNVWRKIDLDEIGIPRTCKFIVTTRVRDVCRVMDVHDANTLQMDLMNTNEARDLFKSHAGNQVVIGEYKNVVQRLLKKCGGLPLAIVATANSLKDKDLSSWEKFADDLEKPISSQVTGEYRHTYPILGTSYKFIEADEKRMFFLLASLIPIGASVSIESLMRYGIGLDLFQYVNKLCEAMEQAGTWADELVKSSMLLEGDVKGDVKIHDIVRAFAIKFAAKEEGHKFMVGGIPRWLNDETLSKYTAMSLASRSDYSRLSGVEACKLQILILKGDMSPKFDDFFFKGMVNLEVLALTNMDFQPSLPESIRKLKKLRTLCMEGCKLGDIKHVGELVHLLVLSLRESFLEELPNEIEELCKLRLLDLSGSTVSKVPLIPPGVLNKLSTLEGLYMFSNKQSERGLTYVNENTMLPYLNAFEIKVAEKQVLPIDDQSFQNVDRFRVSVGFFRSTDENFQPFCRVLYFRSLDNVSQFLKKCGLKVLLRKADYLRMESSDNFENLVPQLDQDGFRDLRSLEVRYCDDIKCIVDANDSIVFPSLLSLSLVLLNNLKMVCSGEASLGSFWNLQTLELSHLHGLQYGLPLVPYNLKEINVTNCQLLKYLFIEEEETHVIKLPSLKTLCLIGVPCLLGLIGPKTFSLTDDGLQGQQNFFDKIVLPSIELFLLVSCNAIQLWSTEISNSGFHNLKDLTIQNCHKLSSVGSPSVFSILVLLETLIVTMCEEISEVIPLEDTQEVITFLRLKYLELADLCKLESFYMGGSKIEFPKLKKLKLSNLTRMTTFVKTENSSAFFHETIDFPCLEELQVSNVNAEVMGLWRDMQALNVMSNPAPMLRQLTLGNTAGLPQVPSEILKNLSSLTLVDFQNDGAVFGSSDLGENKRFVLKYSQLPNLKELKVQNNESLKELFQKEEDCNVDNDSLKLFCGQLKTLTLYRLQRFNLMPLHLFKGLASLTLYGLGWECMTSADALGDSLQQLQFLGIEDCKNMKVLVIKVDFLIKLHSLKQLCLRNLSSLKSFSSTPKGDATLLLPSLESVEILDCNYLEHFWSGLIVAPRLQEVILKECGRLEQFLSGNPKDTIELSSLRKVEVWWCQNMKSFSSGLLITPKLREVELSECRMMNYFSPGNPNHNGVLQLPSLEIVDIGVCPNLRSFSLIPLLAPKLTQIKYKGTEYSMFEFDDLNHFLQQNIY